MTFEKFTGNNLRMGKPQASVMARGQIGINKGALVKYELDRYKYATLFYDKGTKTVGIKFTTTKEGPGALKLSKREDAGFTIGALSFCRAYDAVHAKVKRYPLEFNEEHGLYTFQLDPKALS